MLLYSRTSNVCKKCRICSFASLFWFFMIWFIFMFFLMFTVSRLRINYHSKVVVGCSMSTLLSVIFVSLWAPSRPPLVPIGWSSHTILIYENEKSSSITVEDDLECNYGINSTRVRTTTTEKITGEIKTTSPSSGTPYKRPTSTSSLRRFGAENWMRFGVENSILE